MTLLCFFLATPAAHAINNKKTALTPVFCHALVKHESRADVAYQDGIDLQGRPVVPADLASGQRRIEVPKEINIPLTADMLHFLKVDKSKFPFNAMGQNDINLGMLTVRGGKVFFNGKPLTDEQQDNLAVLCMKPTQKP